MGGAKDAHGEKDPDRGRSGLRPRSDDAALIPHGTKVGSFVIDRRLGEGGMGVVYAAHDERLHRRVALKLLHLAAGDDPEAGQRRILREAQAMARVSQRNLVTIYEVGVYGDRVFLAMEYVEGVPLGTWLRAAPRRQTDILEVFEQVGLALIAVHNAGLVHRDVKPDNIMVDPTGHAKLLDLGIAKRYELPDELKSSVVSLAKARDAGDTPTLLDDSGPHGQDQTGTPAYMSPEQLLGTDVGPASDQFSAAVALYEALVGVRPFEGKDELERISRTIAGDVRPWPEDSDVPPRLQRVIERMLSGEPKDRFPTLRAALEETRRAVGIQGQIRFLTTRWLRYQRDPDFLIPEGRLLDEGCRLLEEEEREFFAPEEAELIRASARRVRRRKIRRRSLLAGCGAIALTVIPTTWLLRRRTAQLELATVQQIETTIDAIQRRAQGLAEHARSEILLMASQHPVWMPMIEELRLPGIPQEQYLLDHLRSTIGRLNEYFVPMLQHSLTASSVMVSTQDMELLVFDDPDGKHMPHPYTLYNRLVDLRAFGQTALEIFWNGTSVATNWLEVGDRDQRGQLWEGYDPGRRVFVQDAWNRAPGRVVWTDAYLFFITKDVGITGSTAFEWRDQRHVLAMDITLADISTITTEVDAPGVTAVVLTTGDRIVGLPRDARFRDEESIRTYFTQFERERRGDDPARLPRIQDLGRPLLDAMMDASRTTERSIFALEFDGQVYWVGRGPVGQPEQNLEVFVIAKRAEQEHIVRRRRQGHQD